MEGCTGSEPMPALPGHTRPLLRHRWSPGWVRDQGCVHPLGILVGRGRVRSSRRGTDPAWARGPVPRRVPGLPKWNRDRGPDRDRVRRREFRLLANILTFGRGDGESVTHVGLYLGEGRFIATGETTAFGGGNVPSATPGVGIFGIWANIGSWRMWCTSVRTTWSGCRSTGIGS